MPFPLDRTFDKWCSQTLTEFVRLCGEDKSSEHVLSRGMPILTAGSHQRIVRGYTPAVLAAFSVFYEQHGRLSIEWGGRDGRGSEWFVMTKVPSHAQEAFQHPKLRPSGKKPGEAAEHQRELKAVLWIKRCDDIIPIDHPFWRRKQLKSVPKVERPKEAPPTVKSALKLNPAISPFKPSHPHSATITINNSPTKLNSSFIRQPNNRKLDDSNRPLGSDHLFTTGHHTNVVGNSMRDLERNRVSNDVMMVGVEDDWVRIEDEDGDKVDVEMEGWDFVN